MTSKQKNKSDWKISSLEDKLLSLDEEIQAMRKKDLTRENRLADLEKRNRKLEECVEKLGLMSLSLVSSIAQLRYYFSVVKLTGKTERPEVSLKESLLQILDSCLDHEDRLIDVERKFEDSLQLIRSLHSSLYHPSLSCPGLSISEQVERVRRHQSPPVRGKQLAR